MTSLVYRTAGLWGVGKGSNLTSAEVDTNFSTLDGLIAAYSPVAPYDITSVTVSDDQMTLLLSDGRSLGPFTLPSPAFKLRGAYLAGYLYHGGDIFSINGNMYLVLQAFTSAGTFNPADTINSKPVAVCVGGTPVLHDMAFYVPGTPGALDIFQHVATRGLTLQSAIAYMRVAPSSDQVFTVKKSGGSIGTFTIANGQQTANAAITATLAAGDIITVSPPGSPSGADLSVTMLFRRIA